jgi:DNA-binding NarL/FixJ family response regulator
VNPRAAGVAAGEEQAEGDQPESGGPVPPLRLVVADHEEATRTGIRLALAPRGFTVEAEAASRNEAVRAVLATRPHACLVATSLPGGGIRAAKEMRTRAPQVAIAMLATTPGDAELFAALEAGAQGYLLQDTEPAALGEALRGVIRGEAVIPPRLVTPLVLEFRARSAAGGQGREGSQLDCLTARQRDVLELLSNGVGTAEIAHRMAISRTTVRRHSSEIVARLSVDDRDAAIETYRALQMRADRRRMPDRALPGDK